MNFVREIPDGFQREDASFNVAEPKQLVREVPQGFSVIKPQETVEAEFVQGKKPNLFDALRNSFNDFTGRTDQEKSKAFIAQHIAEQKQIPLNIAYDNVDRLQREMGLYFGDDATPEAIQTGIQAFSKGLSFGIIDDDPTMAKAYPRASLTGRITGEIGAFILTGMATKGISTLPQIQKAFTYSAKIHQSLPRFLPAIFTRGTQWGGYRALTKAVSSAKDKKLVEDMGEIGTTFAKGLVFGGAFGGAGVTQGIANRVGLAGSIGFVYGKAEGMDNFEASIMSFVFSASELLGSVNKDKIITEEARQNLSKAINEKFNIVGQIQKKMPQYDKKQAGVIAKDLLNKILPRNFKVKDYEKTAKEVLDLTLNAKGSYPFDIPKQIISEQRAEMSKAVAEAFYGADLGDKTKQALTGLRKYAGQEISRKAFVEKAVAEGGKLALVNGKEVLQLAGKEIKNLTMAEKEYFKAIEGDKDIIEMQSIELPKEEVKAVVDIPEADKPLYEEALKYDEAREYETKEKYIEAKIKEFRFARNREMAEIYAEHIGVDVEAIDQLGSGDRGEAFSTGDGRVIKITSSIGEANIAKQLIGEKGNHAEIYDVKKVGERNFLILQEELKIKQSIENNYEEVMELLDEAGLYVNYIGELDPDNLSEAGQEKYDELSDFIGQLEDVVSEYGKLGLQTPDIKYDNIGIGKDGKLKALDIDEKNQEGIIQDKEIKDFEEELTIRLTEIYNKAHAQASIEPVKEPTIPQTIKDLQGLEPVKAFERVAKYRAGNIKAEEFKLDQMIYEINQTYSDDEQIAMSFLVEGHGVPEKYKGTEVETIYNTRPELREVAKEYATMQKEYWQKYRKLRPNEEIGKIDDYIPHMWVATTKGKVLNHIGKSSRFTTYVQGKKRSIESLVKGMDEFKLTPKELRFGKLLKAQTSKLITAVHNAQFKKDIIDYDTLLRQQGQKIIYRAGEEAPDGYLVIKHKDFKERKLIAENTKMSEELSGEVKAMMTELGISISTNLPKGKVAGVFVKSDAPQIKLQKVFKVKTLTHEIGHYIDDKLGLKQSGFADRHMQELITVSAERIKRLTTAGYGEYVQGEDEVIAEFFALMLTDLDTSLSIAPNATQEALLLLNNEDNLKDLVSFDFANKSKQTIEKIQSIIKETDMKVHPDLERVLQSALGEKLDHFIIKGIETVNQFLKGAQLSYSFFFPASLTESALALNGTSMFTSDVVNLENIANQIIKGELAYFKDPELMKTTDKMIKHGLSLGSTDEVSIEVIDRMFEALEIQIQTMEDQKPGLRKLLDPILFSVKGADKLHKKWNSAIFKYLRNYLKIYSASEVERKEVLRLGRELTTEELEGVADLVNNIYGGQNFEYLITNPVTIQIMSLFMLSPDYAISTVKQALGVLGMHEGDIVDRAIGKTGFEWLQRVYRFWATKSPELQQKASLHFWKKVAVMALFVNGLNMINRYRDIKNNPQFYPEDIKADLTPNGLFTLSMINNSPNNKTRMFIGRDHRGRELNVRWGKQFREPYQWVFNTSQTAGNKASPTIHLLSNIFTGHSAGGFRNELIADKKGLERNLGVIETVFKSLLPFSANALYLENRNYTFYDLAFPISIGYNYKFASEDFAEALTKGDNETMAYVLNMAYRNNLRGSRVADMGMNLLQRKYEEQHADIVNNLEDAEKGLEQARKDDNAQMIRFYMNRVKGFMQTKIEVENKERLIEPLVNKANLKKQLQEGK